ncbi:hypothetical protein FRC02_010136, partial [Tulasnella sp. 418]
SCECSTPASMVAAADQMHANGQIDGDVLEMDVVALGTQSSLVRGHMVVAFTTTMLDVLIFERRDWWMESRPLLRQAGRWGMLPSCSPGSTGQGDWEYQRAWSNIE